MPSASALDAVTIDAFGTLVDLSDPVPKLAAALRRHGEERPEDVVRRAFRDEVVYYLPRAHTGSNPASLLALRTECARVFLASAEAEVEPPDFVDDFVGSLEFRALPGAEAAVVRLRAAGLALACVANWDASLAEYLDRARVAHLFNAIVSAAEAGTPKPDPRIFALALKRLGTPPERALHIGDDEVDHEGAAAAGLSFEPVPLATLPARLGL